ncbi:Three-prime repair exonuclease 1 [Eumeta japonica]|uniref:Three-prime repair exonuclease 1 n=1 Tax=Eumeta variegata TaxID=151549 RepID=A0A4C1ZWJ5_EUMVA|nr:Three-prime repair exonuclease 1 [Eumeta japonica]
MVLIETYLFIDLEATGLPEEENNQTKITELSLVAVSRKHLLTTKAGEAPRVQRKLTLCFNPGRAIRPIAEKLSGLTNVMLDGEPMFGHDTCRLMEMFIKLLNRPVCLVSHGGNYLDFPVLKKQLYEANVSLPFDLRYIDSLDVFYCVTEGANAIGSGFPHSLKIRLAKSYKLRDVYGRLLGRPPPQTHRAEADCLLVLECAVALSSKFVDWVDKHCKLFSQQKCLGS